MSGCETPVESNWIKRLIRAARAGLTSIVIDSAPVDVLDSSGNGRNALLLGNPKPVFVPAYYDKGLYFDGVFRDNDTQGIDFTGTGLGNNPQGIDIEFRIKFNATKGNFLIKGTGVGDAGLEFSLISDGTGPFSWTYRVNLPGDYYLIHAGFYADNSSTPFQTGVWYTIRLVGGIEGSLGYASAFVNGTRTGLRTQPGISSRTVFNNPFYFGRNIIGLDNGPFGGLVDEIRIFDSPQLSSSVTSYTVATSEYAPSGDGLYHLNGAGSSTTISPSSLPKASETQKGIIDFPTVRDVLESITDIQDTEVNFSPITSGQTNFTVSPAPKYPNRADCFINGVRYLFGQHFLFYTTGQFIWLNADFKLTPLINITLKYLKQ